MPVQVRKDKDGCYARWGNEGKKYYYPCNDTKKEGDAKKLATIQGIAIGDYKNTSK